MSDNGASKDILRDWRLALVAYGVPFAAIMASGSLQVGTAWRTAIWTAASLVMGAACLTNAVRCGRVHCFFTARS